MTSCNRDPARKMTIFSFPSEDNHQHVFIVWRVLLKKDGNDLQCSIDGTNNFTVYREFFASGNFGENDAWKVC